MNTEFFLYSELLVVIGTAQIGSVLLIAAASQVSPFEEERRLPDFRIAALGDMGCSSLTGRIINDIKNNNPDVVLALGDLSYQNKANCWFKIISPLVNKIKIVLGEHDHRSSPLLVQYKKYFNLSQEFYSFNYQNVHFIAIATEIPFDVNSPQYNFVKSDLEMNSKNPQNKWIVVFSYRPQYSSPTEHRGNADLRDIYHPLFQKYHVDIVLAGHNHNYQRSYPINYNRADSSNPTVTNNDLKTYEDSTGQLYVTVGTGGAKLYGLDGKEPYVAAQYEGFGFLDLSVTQNGRNMTGIFYSTTDRSIEDRFTLIK